VGGKGAKGAKGDTGATNLFFPGSSDWTFAGVDADGISMYGRHYEVNIPGFSSTGYHDVEIGFFSRHDSGIIYRLVKIEGSWTIKFEYGQVVQVPANCFFPYLATNDSSETIGNLFCSVAFILEQNNDFGQYIKGHISLEYPGENITEIVFAGDIYVKNLDGTGAPY
jgi:hypothetical protein